MKNVDKATKSHIRNIILIFTTSMALAVAIAAGMIVYYGPDGAYIAKNVLLQPSVLEGLSYSDTHPNTGRSERFVFSKIEFHFFDHQKGRWTQNNIDFPTYTRFFKQIANDRSVTDELTEVQQIFETSGMAMLSLKVRLSSDLAGKQGTLPFQEVHFVEKGDHYRIELHDDNPDTTWAYFHHPKIYQKIVTLFNK